MTPHNFPLPHPRRLAAGFLLVAALALPAPSALALGGNEDEPTRSESLRGEYDAAKSALDAGRFQDAARLLETVVAAEPRNANAWNLLAYSNRKLGNGEKAFDLYRKALALDPRHKGAHEYLGELYLDRGDLAAAEDMRARLATLCRRGCEELEELDAAIAGFKSGKAKAPGGS